MTGPFSVVILLWLLAVIIDLLISIDIGVGVGAGEDGKY